VYFILDQCVINSIMYGMNIYGLNNIVHGNKSFEIPEHFDHFVTQRSFFPMGSGYSCVFYFGLMCDK
jgi:hypothetical protein